MALQPFSWGQGGEKLNPSQVKRYSDIAAALAARTGSPKTFGEGLNRVGEALVSMSYGGRAEAGEAAGADSRKAIMDALMANPDPAMSDLMGAMGNEWVSSDPASSAILQAMIGQEMQANDPLRQLQIEQARIDIENARNPTVEPLVINDQLVDPASQDVLGDYRDAPERWRSLTPDEAAQYGVKPGTPAQINDATGEIKGVGGMTINVGGSSAYSDELDKGFAGKYLELQDQATVAQNALNSFDVMEATMSDPNFYSGAGGEQVQWLKQVGASIGLDPESVSSMETFNAMSKQAALDVMGGSLGTGFSNADRDFVIDQVPNLSNTPEGNRKLIAVQRKLAQRKIEIANLATQYAQANGQLDSGWNDHLREWANANPLFTGEDKRALSGVPEASSSSGAIDYNADAPPEGWGGDPELWRFMSPEDRALW